MVVGIFRTDKVHLVYRAAFRAAVEFVGLVQSEPDSVVRFGGVT